LFQRGGKRSERIAEISHGQEAEAERVIIEIGRLLAPQDAAI
jgi:hypothetical protein